MVALVDALALLVGLALEVALTDVDDELLLPQPASAPRTPTTTTTANQLLMYA